MIENKSKKIELGDYQTPISFSLQVCKMLRDELRIEPDYIFEPTFGLGNFITSSIGTFKSIKNIFGVEINSTYYDEVLDKFKSISIPISIFNESIFAFDFDKIRSSMNVNDNLLIIGNPPWVTNSQLSSLESNNLPQKNNFKGLNGFDAITGSGNFDIAEYIILKLLSEFQEFNNVYISMLCKNTVAKNILRDLKKYNFSISKMNFYLFDAKSIFDVNCEAGVLVIKLGNKQNESFLCDVYDFVAPNKKLREFGWFNNKFISDIDKYRKVDQFDGECEFEWRQGIKHDCSKVMELSLLNNEYMYINGFNDVVDIEDGYVYPLLKSSNIKEYIITQTRKYVIVTQSRVNQETESIKTKLPKLWKYLNQNTIYFENRKSSIYRRSPRFSIFGIGDYSFTKYKVIISGFYKEPIFALAYGDKPIMVDDTCYFIGFNDYNDALVTMLMLNSELVQNFIKSIVFIDSKRPYTKEILMRISFKKISYLFNFPDLVITAKNLGVKIDLTEDEFNKCVIKLNQGLI